MAVVARCHGCGDEHPLGDRPTRGDGPTVTTTECPGCGDTRYESDVIGDAHVKPNDERIADAIRDVRGVGAGTLANVQEAFGLYVELEAASVDDLLEIDGVGQQTAEGIREAVA